MLTRSIFDLWHVGTTSSSSIFTPGNNARISDLYFLGQAVITKLYVCDKIQLEDVFKVSQCVYTASENIHLSKEHKRRPFNEEGTVLRFYIKMTLSCHIIIFVRYTPAHTMNGEFKSVRKFLYIFLLLCHHFR